MPTGKVSRRHFLQLFGATTVATLAACAPQPTPVPQAEPTAKPADTEVPVAEPTAVPPAPAEAVKIVVYVGFGTGTDPSQIEVHNAVAKEWNDAHPDVQVEFLTVPYEERNTKFSTMLAGDMAPDLAMPIGVGGLAAFFDEWQDLTPYVERDKYDMSDFVGATVQIHTYPGRLIGLPMGVYPEVTYYNEDLFDAAELEYPPHKFGDPTWTFDKVVDVSQRLTLDENGNNALAAGFNWETTKQWGWDGLSWIGSPRDVAPKWGGSPMGVSDDYKTAQFNTDAYIACAQWMTDSIWKWHIRATGEQSQAFNEAGDPMGSGMVGLWVCQSWMNYAYSGWTDAFNWNVAALPMVASVGKVFSDEDADTFSMCKHGKNQDQAWEVAKFFASPEILPRLGDTWGCLPARQSALGGWKASMTEKYGEKDWQVFLDSIDYMFLPNAESWIPDSEKILDTLNKGWELLSTGEETDVKKVIDASNAEVQGILDEYWKTH